MATAQANKKVYVSPGVYTSETDLSFVAQSVGVTTLGLVGESLKGPAFEPVFITNYDEFQTFFGGTSPEKFVNTQIPKYESAYIAKSYLQQSNQMFFTRILGLSGYDAGPSWSIKLIANVEPNTIGFTSTTPETALSVPFDVTNGVLSFPSGGIPTVINNALNTQYRMNDGSVSTYYQDISSVLNNAVQNLDIIIDDVFIYGAIPQNDYNTLSSAFINLNSVYNCEGNFAANDLSSGQNDAWFYANFNNTTGEDYYGYSFYYTIPELTPGVDDNNYSGTLNFYQYNFSGTAYEDYHKMVIATLRSRGTSLYNTLQHGPQYMVSNLSNVSLITTGQYSASVNNPFSTFLISATTDNNQTFTFEASLSLLAPNYISKVFGLSNFDKSKLEVPLFIEEIYPLTLSEAYDQGYIRGISTELISLPAASGENQTSIAYNLERYQSPTTPFLVSELRGNKVYDLFRFISISDGDVANVEVKISIANLSFNNMTFDVLVRSFTDTDANPVVFERFTNCSMNPDSPSYIAKRIGTANGEYPLLSKFIMVELATDAPIDALPCGFNGYTQRLYDSLSEGNLAPRPFYKTRYYFPGEVISNPPFDLPSGTSNAIEASGDIVRRNYLGFSTSMGIDESLLTYKGKQNPSGWQASPTPVEGGAWKWLSPGFHMDSGATVVTISSQYYNSGKTAFECGITNFTEDPTDQTNPYYYIYSRKFTLCFAGGFDGWDIYREWRTNEDRFQLGSAGFLAGSSPSTRYPTASGYGLFKRIIVENNTQDFANTDYYAYLLGILTFNNPESTNINVFATTGFDYKNNLKLAEETIDMIQYQRADSVYIATTPDYEMYNPNGSDPQAIYYSQEVVENLDASGLDSNYTSTYYPWILVRDTVNNTQIYLPPTGEVCRNLALTDNIAFPWFASAGYTRGLVNSVKARVKLTQEDRDTLYQGRINPIATFSDVGTVIWGNKTLQVADTALNRLNVRRLLLQARKLISAVAVRLLFEQNDQIVRQQFLDSVNPILDSIRRDRGLYDFRVTVSSSPEDLDRNTLSGKIYLKPTKALEFIDIEFFITPTGASFENI
jgi:hypothetical protein